VILAGEAWRNTVIDLAPEAFVIEFLLGCRERLTCHTLHKGGLDLGISDDLRNMLLHYPIKALKGLLGFQFVLRRTELGDRVGPPPPPPRIELCPVFQFSLRFLLSHGHGVLLTYANTCACFVFGDTTVQMYGFVHDFVKRRED
jgi:hypothetical protein